MNSQIPLLEECHEYLLTGVLIFLAVMLILVLIKACMGPSVADRIVCINMMGTMVMPLTSISLSLILTLVVTGITIGILGSIVSVKKYLKV